MTVRVADRGDGSVDAAEEVERERTSATVL